MRHAFPANVLVMTIVVACGGATAPGSNPDFGTDPAEAEMAPQVDSDETEKGTGYDSDASGDRGSSSEDVRDESIPGGGRLALQGQLRVPVGLLRRDAGGGAVHDPLLRRGCLPRRILLYPGGDES
jgi:hypothetical protein